MKPFDIVLYDYLQVAGGAERFALVATEELSKSSLTVSRIFSEAESLQLPNDAEFRTLGTRTTAYLPRVVESIACFKFRTRFLANVSSVLYSGIYAPMAVSNQKNGLKMYYCHTPPRYAYDMRRQYASRVQPLLRPLFNCFADYIQGEYEASLRQMNKIFTNSENVRRRLYTATGINSMVLYPPVDTHRFFWLEQGSYFISLARLTKKKNIDAIVSAFLKLPTEKLIIASGGSEMSALKKLANNAPNIYFTGWCTDEELRDLIGRARAAIYLPEDEDFGMSPVEAMAAGKPVIGCANGGLLETVENGVSGILIPAPIQKEHLIQAILDLSATRASSMRFACEQKAAQFSRENFIRQLHEALHHG